jgi:predicted O-linked N-acetylglucosamine transferase (SPINDLY family)
MQKTLTEAARQYHAGRLEEAERICRAIISRPGEHAEALHLSAAIALRQGNLAMAEQQVLKAIEERPGEGNFYNTLGVVLRSQGKAEQARDCYLQVLKLSPGNAEAAFNLANVLSQLEEYAEAIYYYKQACARNKHYLSAYLNLGHLHRKLGALKEAERCFQKGISQVGEKPEFLFGLGLLQLDQGHCQKALELFQQVIQCQPQYAEAHLYAGNALHSLGHVTGAEGEHRLCISLKPDYPIAWNNLGNDLRDQGRLVEARDAYRKALQLKPDYMRAHSNLLFAQLYDMADSQAVYEEHLKWGSVHTAGLMLSDHGSKHDPDPQRKLRIGYVSPDFKEHSVAYFIEPLLAAYDHTCFEVYCFSDVSKPDAITERLKGHVDQWLDISACSDDAVADMIRQEGIDILVDLAGHTSRHRLLVFARKPAPVQVTYLGYPATTGMKAIDYRLSDELADPVGSGGLYSEDLIRLPKSFLCYAPPAIAPDVSPSPCLTNGFVSFGSFNHLTKVTEAVISAWSQILLRLPGSRMVLKHISLQDPSTQDRYLRLFESCGVARDRITLLSWSDSVRDHLACYAAVDIALDTFPYNGTTTTCESLWMGVPVITVAGQDHVSRVGLSLLKNAGLEDLVMGDVHEYIEKAVDLATDRKHLSILRTGMRNRISNSVLCDQQVMAMALGQAYRNIWQQYCAGQHAEQAQ